MVVTKTTSTNDGSVFTLSGTLQEVVDQLGAENVSAGHIAGTSGTAAAYIVLVMRKGR